MALRNILLQDDKTLRKISRPVNTFGKRTQELLDDMRDTLIEARGAGLAAPQVGILRRAVIILHEGEFVELINPEITVSSEEQVGIYEGCLSCPGLRGYLLRPKEVTVHAQNRHGEWFDLDCADMAARAACHEIDHLNGILYLDLVDETITEEELDEMLKQVDDELDNPEVLEEILTEFANDSGNPEAQ